MRSKLARDMLIVVTVGLVLATMLCTVTASAFSVTRKLEVTFVSVEPFAVMPEANQEIEVVFPGTSAHVYTVLSLSDEPVTIGATYEATPELSGVIVEVSPSSFTLPPCGAQEVAVVITAGRNPTPCTLSITFAKE